MSELKATYGEKEWQVGDTALFCGKEVTVVDKDIYGGYAISGVTVGWFSISGIFYEKILKGLQTELLKRVQESSEPPKTITDAAGQTWTLESLINDAIGPEDTMMFQNTYKKRGQDVWEKPLYKHDCESCIFLGRFKGDDLYFHGKDKCMPRDQLLSRHSSEDSDYEGYPYSVGKAWTHDIPSWWNEAVRVARERGLIK